MKKNDKIYLAHSVELVNPVRRWEVNTESKFRIDLINPMRKNDFENVDEIKSLTSRKKVVNYMQTLSTEISEKIVKYDLELLRKCDGLLAVFNSPSIGTSQEIFAAHYLYQIPVYVICGDYTAHPWIQSIVKQSGGKAFRTKRQFTKYLDEQGLRRK